VQNANTLFSENKLLLQPELAAIIGLNEAIVLEQVRYWLKKNEEAEKAKTHFHEGRWWMYNSLEKWGEQFPFWSTKTIQRTLERLEADGLIEVGKFNKSPFNQTKWYTINTERLQEIHDEHRDGQADHIEEAQPSDQAGYVEADRLTTSSPDKVTISYTETIHTETTSHKDNEHKRVLSRTQKRMYKKDGIDRFAKLWDEQMEEILGEEAVDDNHFTARYNQSKIEQAQIYAAMKRLKTLPKLREAMRSWFLNVDRVERTLTEQGSFEVVNNRGCWEIVYAPKLFCLSVNQNKDQWETIVSTLKALFAHNA
jgi:DNA-binding HxlR family transcriptional regulator